MASSGRLDELLLKSVREIADYQFGPGAGEALFPSGCRVEISKRTKRPRRIYLDGKLLATVRPPDNFLALTLEGGERLLKGLGEKAPVIIVKNKFVDKVRKGMSVMAHHVLKCSDEIRPGDEVIVVDEGGSVIAVGRAAAASQTIRDLRSGVVVKVRKYRKTDDQN